MKQFDLKEYLANPSRKIVTQDGKKARIICTDRRDSKFPVVALIENELGEGETTLYYTESGKLYSNDYSCNNDLYFAAEKHEGWVNLYKSLDKDCAYYLGDIYNYRAEARGRRFNNNNYNYVATIKIEWEE